MFLVNSRLGLFTAAPFPEHPFSRSYGVILPSSLTIVLSLTLGFSPHLPVSVCGTGTYGLASGFSWQCEISCFQPCGHPITPQNWTRGFAYQFSLDAWTRITNSVLNLSFCVPTSLKRLSVVQEYQPVVHRLQRLALGLGPDLPWADEPSPGILRFSAGRILTCLTLLMPTFSLLCSPPCLPAQLLPAYDAPLPITLK